jgi:hypothetical protein
MRNPEIKNLTVPTENGTETLSMARSVALEFRLQG